MPWELDAMDRTLHLFQTFLGSRFDAYMRSNLAIRRVHTGIYKGNRRASTTELVDPAAKYPGMSVILLTTDMFYPGHTTTRQTGMDLDYLVMHELFHAYSFSHGTRTYRDPYATIVKDFAPKVGWQIGTIAWTLAVAGQLYGHTYYEGIIAASQNRYGVEAPRTVTDYAGTNMLEDFAETARDFALLWLAEKGYTGNWVYDHLVGHRSLGDRGFSNRLAWLQGHFDRTVTQFTRTGPRLSP